MLRGTVSGGGLFPSLTSLTIQVERETPLNKDFTLRRQHQMINEIVDNISSGELEEVCKQRGIKLLVSDGSKH
jgi:hypothetical protein